MDVHRILYTTRGAGQAVAKALGISDAAVSQWRKRGIPPARLPEVRTALEAHLQSIGTPAAAEPVAPAPAQVA